MAEVVRVATFTSVEFEPGDWEGPHREDDLLTYKSRTALASLKVVRDTTVVFDRDYPKGKIITICANVIHLPEGDLAEV